MMWLSEESVIVTRVPAEIFEAYFTVVALHCVAVRLCMLPLALMKVPPDTKVMPERSLVEESAMPHARVMPPLISLEVLEPIA